MKQLSGQDAMFLFLETPKMPLHIGGVYIFTRSEKEEPFDFETFKTYIDNRLHLSRVFRQRLIMVPMDLGKPFWVEDPDFDLNHHLFHVALPKPGKLRELAELAAQIYNPPLNRERPMWKLTFVTGLENIEGISSENAFAMIAQVHHSMIDGASGVEIMSALLDPTPEPREVKRPRKKWKPERIPTGVELLARSYSNSIGTPFKFVNFLTQHAPKAFDVRSELKNHDVKKPEHKQTAPKSIFNVPVSSNKVFGAIDVPLEQLKQIKNEVENATVNDVILSICGGALRRYLKEKKKLPRRSLVAASPISIRTKKASGKMGNKISVMFPKIGTNISDPIERLEKISRKTKSSVKKGRAMGADKIMELVPSEVAALAGRLYTKLGLSEIHKPFVNLIITNVPGPKEPLYMNGFQLVQNYGFGAVFDGIGLMIVVFSYAGNVSICATSCKEIIPDMTNFTRYVHEEVDELTEALGI